MPTASTPVVLKKKVEKAVQDGHFQKALELAKQLHSQAPTRQTGQLLLKAYLGRARQLRQQGQFRDAGTVLKNTLPLLDGEPAWLEPIAEELAANGQIADALNLLEPLPDSPARPRILARAADFAVQQGAAGRNILPEALQPAFDLVLQAFAQQQAGEDEATRTTLQGIGLQSPFLEWKLLLRGLLAYYENDDARALENWSRLTADRLPARLAAPLRFRIDAPFRLAQPPETQAHLQRQGDRLQGSPLVQALRALQAALSGEDLAQAFRLVQGLLPSLRQDFPHLVPHLASCFYWGIVHFGEPKDIERYRRLFGTPADDPQFARMGALGAERHNDLEEAHRSWHEFEQSVTVQPAAWGGHADRVRALVWWHMGENAESVPDAEQLKKLPAFLRNHPDRPRPLKPSAEACFRRSLELAPDDLETHVSLVEHYQKRNDAAKAEKAGRQLLERFPDHAGTLEMLAELCRASKKYEEMLGLLQRALKVNPLEQRLRAKVSHAHAALARARTEAERYDEARQEYQAALAFFEGHGKFLLHCQWAACEFRAGQAERAEELIAQARTDTGQSLPVAHAMLAESVRYKLPKDIKGRFDKEFTAALAGPAEAAAAFASLGTAAAYHGGQITYYGQKTHAKKLVTYLGRVPGASFSEVQVEGVCAALLRLQEVAQARKFADLGMQRFPQSPQFPLLYVESYLGPRRRDVPWWQVAPLLDRAEKLARDQPSERSPKLLERIAQCRAVLGVERLANGPPGFLENMIEEVFGNEDDYDD
jgi:tetratricopeptide (TPR) repeat protein